MPTTNPFIVIEALDAGGSQTQTDLLAGRLQGEGYQVLQLHFPQEDRATGRLIYDKFLLKKNEKPFTRREQALLYIQDFYSRVEDIREATERSDSKTAVVSDRYVTSTFAYQTVGLPEAERNEMFDWIQWLCYEGTPVLPKPDAVIFLDTPVAVSMRRLAGKKKDFFETEEKLTSIREAYLRIAKKQHWRMVASVDAQDREHTREDLSEEIWQQVQKLLA